MADEDWESELDNGPACVPSSFNQEPNVLQNSRNSFSSSQGFNENFSSNGQSFGNQKGDRNGRGSFSGGRSDEGRGGNSNRFNRGFDSDNQERSGFSTRGGFNNDNFRSRGRGGRGGNTDGMNNQRDFGRTDDNGGFDNKRDYGRKDDGDSSSRGYGGRGGGNFGRRGGGSFEGRRDFGKRGDDDHSEGKRDFGRAGDSGSFGNFSRKGNNEESDRGGMFERTDSSDGFGNTRDFGSRGGYRGKNEEVGFNSEKGQDNPQGADAGPKVTYVPPAPSDAEEDIFKHYQTGINFDKYDDILVDVCGSNAPPAILSFEDTDLTETLTKNVYKAGYVKLTPIQKHSIPIIMAGRDLMACAQTGSGKTAAFLLPILAHMMKSGVASSQFTDLQEPEAIIVAPTRELINQIYMDARKFAYGTIVRPVVIYGGTQTSHSLRQIFQGCNVLCATPGRLLDVIGKQKIGLSKVKYLVLDEADRMLDMGFLEDIKKLLGSPGMPGRDNRQTLMFSATFPAAIQSLAKEILKPDYLFVVVGQVGGACSDVKQQIIEVVSGRKRDKLLEILQNIEDLGIAGGASGQTHSDPTFIPYPVDSGYKLFATHNPFKIALQSKVNL